MQNGSAGGTKLRAAPGPLERAELADGNSTLPDNEKHKRKHEGPLDESRSHDEKKSSRRATLRRDSTSDAVQRGTNRLIHDDCGRKVDGKRHAPKANEL